MLLLGILFALFFFALYITYFTFSWGVTLYFFWYWFLIPVFPDLPQVTFWNSVGLMLFISLFKYKSINIPIKDEYLKTEETTQVKIIFYLSPWITLLIGLFIKYVLTII